MSAGAPPSEGPGTLDTSPDYATLTAADSRELLLVCDAAGTVRFADARAERHLGLRSGSSLLGLAAPGGEPKLGALLSGGSGHGTALSEVPLIVGGTLHTFGFSARPDGHGGVVLLGSLVPAAHTHALAEMQHALDEVVSLNREITRQKRELARHKTEMERAYRELDDSNRGVLSLHAELQDKSETLQRTAEIKTRVVANVSHEFRTPLHAILGLSKLLLDKLDGPLLAEQEKQVRFIQSSARELAQMVDDLLDLSTAESGKSVLRPRRFAVDELFAALRGTLRPLLSPGPEVELIFDPPGAPLSLDTDDSKLGQILRNLVSNALKFTERGSVRVSVAAAGERVLFRVTDTGIGIAPEHFERVFEEFGQVESSLQAQVKGTGLGLPLSRKLAEVLGGTLTVESEVGRGSVFTLSIPAVHPDVTEMNVLETRPLDASRAPLLVVEDDRKTLFIYEKYLSTTGFQVVPARNIADARRLLETITPAAIVLDIMLEGEASWDFLAQLKRDERTRDIPTLVVTVTNKEQKARALGADEFWLKPLDKDRLLRKLESVRPGASAKVLVIDDDEKARYLLRRFLDDGRYQLFEAANCPDAVRMAREHLPDVIFLDFFLQDATAFDVLDELKADPRTRAIPVIIVTSHTLSQEERERLAAGTTAILSKESLSRELALNRIRDALRKAGLGTAPIPPELPS